MENINTIIFSSFVNTPKYVIIQVTESSIIVSKRRHLKEYYDEKRHTRILRYKLAKTHSGIQPVCFSQFVSRARSLIDYECISKLLNLFPCFNSRLAFSANRPLPDLIANDQQKGYERQPEAGGTKSGAFALSRFTL